MNNLTPEAARYWFAEDLRVSAPVVNNSTVVKAFATVPREQFLGPGPWRIHPRLLDAPPYLSTTDHPQEIYHDVLVSIDEQRDLNNGQPSLWAFVFDRLHIQKGQTVLQIGAGVGYFTAILAHLVGVEGKVIAYEIDWQLSEKARKNLHEYKQVEFSCGDAVNCDTFPKLDRIVAFAGATHPPKRWLQSLADGGRMMLPLTASDRRGFMMLLERDGDKNRISSLGPCGFYHCESARKASEGTALRATLDTDREALGKLDQLFTTPADETSSNVWFAGEDFWISKRPH